MPTLCLGEALVDLVCERPVASLAETDAFVPHFGGATANVAVAAARTGAAIALVGAAGADAWGEWLRARLQREGVELDWFVLVTGCVTPVAFVTSDHIGEPTFAIYAEGIAATIAAIAPRLDEAVDESDGLFFTSNTLAGDEERRLTLAARERALALGLPVCFDANLRLHRWRTAAAAAAACNECVPGSFLVRCNDVEAQLMTGERDATRAAEALVKTGARLAVVTRGSEGAVLRGEVRADVGGVRAEVLSTMGAGDALMGVLLGRLAQAAYYPPVVAAALPEAVAEAARATERWGAVA